MLRTHNFYFIALLSMSFFESKLFWKNLKKHVNHNNFPTFFSDFLKTL